MKKTLLILVFLTMTVVNLQAQKKKKPSKVDSVVTLNTKFGDITMILFEETPQHRSNFLKLAKEGFYNDLLFHRVMKGFMIQGGDPESRNASKDQRLGRGGLPYKVQQEFNPKFIHKKGALAAARQPDQVNPEKASSSTQFYIVQGRKISLSQLARSQNKYTEAQLKIYEELGGAPHLDMNYTIYGEVISGLEVVDKIAEQMVDRADRPLEDVKMTVTVKKMKKKKITKLYGYQYSE